MITKKGVIRQRKDTPKSPFKEGDPSNAISKKRDMEENISKLPRRYQVMKLIPNAVSQNSSPKNSNLFFTLI